MVVYKLSTFALSCYKLPVSLKNISGGYDLGKTLRIHRINEVGSFRIVGMWGSGGSAGVESML